ncbi:hypothetical protein BJ508DRAFT_377184 [Ascobolus immersus RN42]|uniref:Uncharacterized protein n=1 Tax=Ascobolus immersus RN42 TaxID=1160509 RepID=A0A3N4I888_ASCIM|nr:hypothetical protein BJ508DRAFT_377184 [Ascobolus immersus RN42]
MPTASIISTSVAPAGFLHAFQLPHQRSSGETLNYLISNDPKTELSLEPISYLLLEDIQRLQFSTDTIQLAHQILKADDEAFAQGYYDAVVEHLLVSAAQHESHSLEGSNPDDNRSVNELVRLLQDSWLMERNSNKHLLSFLGEAVSDTEVSEQDGAVVVETEESVSKLVEVNAIEEGLTKEQWMAKRLLRRYAFEDRIFYWMDGIDEEGGVECDLATVEEEAKIGTEDLLEELLKRVTDVDVALEVGPAMEVAHITVAQDAALPTSTLRRSARIATITAKDAAAATATSERKRNAQSALGSSSVNKTQAKKVKRALPAKSAAATRRSAAQIKRRAKNVAQNL